MKRRGKGGREGLRACHFEGKCWEASVVVSGAEELLQ